MSRPRGECPVCGAWCETQDRDPPYSGAEARAPEELLVVVRHFPPLGGETWSMVECTGALRQPVRLVWGRLTAGG